MTEALVCVLWTDAHGNTMAVYEQHEVPHAPAMVRTFGLLVRQDAAGITLANEIFEGGSYRGITFIPAGMIRSITHYQTTKARRRPTTNAKPCGPEENVE